MFIKWPEDAERGREIVSEQFIGRDYVERVLGKNRVRQIPTKKESGLKKGWVLMQMVLVSKESYSLSM